MKDRWLWITPTLGALLLLGPPVAAQDRDCNVLCAPVFTFQPGMSVSNWLDAPRVRRVSDGAEFELDSTTDFLLRFAMAIPTAIPRLSLAGVVQWRPWAGADTRVNPLTGRDVDEEVNANAPDILYVGSFGAITTDQTNGWFSLAADIFGLFSPAAQPGDDSFYTHKLVLELGPTIYLFNSLPRRNWLRNLSLYGLLDYTATGLPDDGDIVAGLEYLDGADPWGIVVGLNIPLAPLPR